MRVVVGFAVVAGVILGLAGAAQASSSSSKPVVLTPAQVAPALLTTGDFDPGWTLSPGSSSVDAPSKTNGICNGPNAASRAQSAKGDGVAAATFYLDQTVGPAVSEYVWGFPSTKAAQSFLAATKSVGTPCKSQWDTANPTQANIRVHWTVAPLSVAKHGDQVVGLREVATNVLADGSSGASDTTDTTYVRVANNVVEVQRVAGIADTTALETSTQKALSKLGSVLRTSKTTTTTAP